MDPDELPMELDELYPDSLRAQSRTFSYHIRGEREENSNIHIAGMGLHERMKPCWNTRPRGNPDYLCLYFYDPVEFFLDGDRVSSPENKWIILTPSVLTATAMTALSGIIPGFTSPAGLLSNPLRILVFPGIALSIQGPRAL